MYMYGLGTVGGAELDTWNQWESLQHILLIEYIVASHFSVCQPPTLIYTHYRMFINAHLV